MNSLIYISNVTLHTISFLPHHLDTGIE